MCCCLHCDYVTFLEWHCSTRPSVSEIRLNTTCEVRRLAFHTCLVPRLPVLQFGVAFSSPAFSDHAFLTVRRLPVSRFHPPPFKEEEINSSKCLRQADWCKRLMTPGSDSGHIRRMENAHFHSRIFSHDTIRYDTRCYFNVRSKADISRLNPPHGNDN